jgi:hypothetical protein
MPTRIAVIEVEIANHRAVDERGDLERRLATVADHSASILTGSLPLRDAAADLGRLAVTRA